MNFRWIDFHVHPGHVIEDSKMRAHRLRINHLIDSITLRVPRGLATEFFSKLNVTVMSFKAFKTKHRFWHFEKIGYVEYFDPRAEDILSLSGEEIVKLVRSYLLRGVFLAAKHDSGFAKHLKTVRGLIKTAHMPYDLRTGVTRTLKPQGLWAELIVRIQAQRYSWDVEIRGKDSLERITLWQTDPGLAFTRFSDFRLKFNGNEIELTKRSGVVLGKQASRLCAGENSG